MSFIVSFALVIAISAVFHRQIKRYPVVFYILAGLIGIAGIYFTLSPNPNPLIRAGAFAIQKGHVGLSLFALVMFIGVFDKRSAIRRLYNPIRAELSIMGAILILSHLTPYLSNYLGMAAGLLSLDLTILTSLVISFIMLALLIVLTATSINAVRQRMDACTWKKVQLSAYPFFGLIFLHLAGYMVVPVIGGSTSASINLLIYGVLFLAYAALRIRKAVLDRAFSQHKLQEAEPGAR